MPFILNCLYGYTQRLVHLSGPIEIHAEQRRVRKAKHLEYVSALFILGYGRPQMLAVFLARSAH